MDALELAIKDLIKYAEPEYLEQITGYNYDYSISDNKNVKNLNAVLKKYYLEKSNKKAAHGAVK